MSMVIIHAGAKDHPIILQKRTKQRTESGGVKYAWNNEYSVMASRRDSRGGEDYESSQKVGYGSTTWRIWFRDDINQADWRVKDEYSGCIYDIKSIVMIGRRQELELLAEIKDNEDE